MHTCIFIAILTRSNAKFNARSRTSSTQFAPIYNGILAGVILKYRSGNVRCYGGGDTHWGCKNIGFSTYLYRVGNDNFYFPKYAKHNGNFYKLLEYGLNDNTLILSDNANNFNINRNERYWLQYAEGYKGQSTHDNGGETFADVYFIYQSFKRGIICIHTYP